ncbi:MAG: alpha/beta hydrolase-fold protein [Betaproteobacteria bacterium]
MSDPLAPVIAHLRAAMPGLGDHDAPRFARAITVDEPYRPGPDAQPRAGVPEGRLVAHRHRGERAYPGVERGYQVYVPAQYDAATPACLLVLQDGSGYLGPETNARTVLDNLIHARQMPVTIAVFVDPGEQGPGLPIYGGTSNRSVEYDRPDDAYVRFLVDELLPAALAGLNVTAEPQGRAICGISSSAQCAFAAAWHRPDVFSKVISHIGSFVDIRGGHEWPQRIRQSPRKNLRVSLQDGDNDLDIVYGHWLQANQAMAAALAYAGYDHQLVIGSGGHSIRHGGSLLPDTLRWLWRDYPGVEAG